MTKKETRGCVTRTVSKYIVTSAGGTIEEVYDKLPTPTRLARKYPNGYSVFIENKLYSIPIARFMEIAEEVTE